ncbi:MAG: L-lactate dehydrogenase [Thermodesulfobacteriota bacterium]
MKIGVVGSGLVGSTSAYAVLMRGIGREVVLVDKNHDRAEAEARDISHAVPFSYPLTIQSGDYADLKGARAVIVSAGVSQRPGESRLELLKRNAAVFEQVVPRILDAAPDAILIVATNPVDIMTHLAVLHAARYGLPSSRVIGTGTMLDTARFRSLVAGAVGVDPHHVHAYVLGEHGDSEVLAWSLVRIGAVTLKRFCELRGINFDESSRMQVDNQVRNAAYAIIEGKGATYYGIGSAVAKIVDVILHDQRSILTVSTPEEEVAGVRNVCVSLPRLVGGDGVLATFPLELNPLEHEALHKSAAVIREAMDELT